MIQHYLLRASIFAYFLVSCSFLFGQEDSTQPKELNISYGEFIQKLSKQNLGYAAEMYNLSIADAEIEASKIFPDPELSFTAYDNQERRMKMGYGFEVELEWDLEMGGKRKARRNLALAERELTQLELIEYFQDLRNHSTVVFLEAIRNKLHYELERHSYERMLDLAKKDSLAFAEGKIKRSRANQIRLEAIAKYNHLQDVADDWKTSLLDIKALISQQRHDTVFVPTGNLENFDRVFNLEELIEAAKENRNDMIMARHQMKISDDKISLEKAERIMDLGLSIGVENNSFAKNIIGPTPGHTAVFAGVSVPLKFSNNRDSGLKVAMYEKEKAALLYQQMILEIEKEITEAYNEYITRQEQVLAMKTNIDQAESIFREELQSYLEDQTSLLEVLNAERTFSRIQNQYLHTLLNHATALVELETLAGIWDIDF